MKETIKNLLKVKSIITILLTVVFAVMIITGLFIPIAIPQEFIMIYSTIIAFYFGTQYQKGIQENERTASINNRTNTEF